MEERHIIFCSHDLNCTLQVKAALILLMGICTAEAMPKGQQGKRASDRPVCAEGGDGCGLGRKSEEDLKSVSPKQKSFV